MTSMVHMVMGLDRYRWKVYVKDKGQEIKRKGHFKREIH